MCEIGIREKLDHCKNLMKLKYYWQRIKWYKKIFVIDRKWLASKIANNNKIKKFIFYRNQFHKTNIFLIQ